MRISFFLRKVLDSKLNGASFS